MSLLADKDADAMLAALSQLGSTLVATASSNPRVLRVDLAELSPVGTSSGSSGSMIPSQRSRWRHGLGKTVLVTGSLYLLADLAAAEPAA